METALIVTGIDKNTSLFTELLKAASIKLITVIKSAAEARRSILQRDFDLVIIDGPLCDECGETLSMDIASNSMSQVIFVVKHEHLDALASACEFCGVLTISKPVNREIFWTALILSKAAKNRINRLQAENVKLKQRIEDIRIVDKAKYILISRLNITEQEAHRRIEKQAMDTRSARRVVAEGIIKNYEV